MQYPTRTSRMGRLWSIQLGPNYQNIMWLPWRREDYEVSMVLWMGFFNGHPCVLFGVRLFVQWCHMIFIQLIYVDEILDSDQHVMENRSRHPLPSHNHMFYSSYGDLFQLGHFSYCRLETSLLWGDYEVSTTYVYICYEASAMRSMIDCSVIFC